MENNGSFICYFCDFIPQKCLHCLECNTYMCVNCDKTIHSKIRGADSHTCIYVNNYTRSSSHGRKLGLSSLSFLKCCRSERKHDTSIRRTLSFSDYLLGTNKVRKYQECYAEQNSKNRDTEKKLQVYRQLDSRSPIENSQNLLKIAEFTVDLPVINRLVYCSDNSIWLTRATQSSLHCVNIGNGCELKTKFSFHIKAFDISAMPTGDLLIASSDSLLKRIKVDGETVENSRYNVEPFLPTSIHVSPHGNLLVGVMSAGPAFPPCGTRQLMALDMDGQTVLIVDRISGEEAPNDVFSYLFSITCDNGGCIYILDRLGTDCEGRIVILNKDGRGRTVYKGHPIFNMEKKFKPKEIVATMYRNIIISEAHNHTLHIVDSKGDLIQYINTLDKWDLSYPQSLACDFRNQLLVGTSRRKGSHDHSKLYIIKM